MQLRHGTVQAMRFGEAGLFSFATRPTASDVATGGAGTAYLQQEDQRK